MFAIGRGGTTFARALRPHAVWVTAVPEPMLVQVRDIQHLAPRPGLSSPSRSARSSCCIRLAPSAGEPGELEAKLIAALEGLARGWYAGRVGWTDATGDGEFCGALRCALLRGAPGALYAGCGIVLDSDLTAELASRSQGWGDAAGARRLVH